MNPKGMPATVQILIALKSKDPTALTAQEAIAHLLGYEDRLVEVRRRHLHELVLGSPAGPAARDGLNQRLSNYLEDTFVFWNPNKQRAWVRAVGVEPDADGSWESVSGRRRTGSFGEPDLDDTAYAHVLLWMREQGGVAADLIPALDPWEVLAYGRGELYSILWKPGSSREERERWTASVAVARSRQEGLLVNPHYQDHRIFHGAVPHPLWAGL